MKVNSAYLVLLLIIFLTGCEKNNEMRVYEETNILPPLHKRMGHEIPKENPSLMPGMDFSQADPQTQEMLKASVASVPVAWNTPEGWNEQQGQGMRLVTFTTDGSDPITCTIISLGGMAGGMESNIIRWMRQVNLSQDLLAGSKMQEFLNNQETIVSKGQIPIQIVDLSSLAESNDLTSPSILGGIIENKDSTIFIKMTGSLNAINEQRELFKSLCRSISFQ